MNDEKIMAKFFANGTCDADLKLVRQNIGIRTNELRALRRRVVRLNRMRQKGETDRDNMADTESDWDSDSEAEKETTTRSTRRSKRRAVELEGEGLSDEDVKEVEGTSLPARKTAKSQLSWMAMQILDTNAFI